MKNTSVRQAMDWKREKMFDFNEILKSLIRYYNQYEFLLTTSNS